MAPGTSRASLDAKTASVLHALYHLSKDQRKAVLKKANRNLVKGICECALNTLKGNVPLNAAQKVKLKKHKSVLRRLSDTQSIKGWKNKKRLIVQKGNGFIGALLAPIIGTIISALIPSRQ